MSAVKGPNACRVCSGTRTVEDTAGNVYVCGECNGSGTRS